jgi:ABC-type amino acid transport system permease subunit
MEEIKYMFYVRNLGMKLRKFIAYCDVCQRCKHPNRSLTVGDIICLRNREIYVPLTYMGDYLRQGEVCVTFLYATMYFIDILTFTRRMLQHL